LTELNVTSVIYFAGLQRLVQSVALDRWHPYIRWQILHHAAPLLAKRFVEEDFKLVRLLGGQKEIRPRWKRCVEATDRALGEALAQPFVKSHFSATARDVAQSMVHGVTKAFLEGVQGLDWMGQKTKSAARLKAEKMAYLIGYPDKWKRYDFVIGPNFAENVLASHRFELRRRLDKVGKAVDRNEWQMSPPTVNAYYDSSRNHMVFPAGILQPPFFDERAAPWVNLGAMGLVVGHELTHGFDDQGSKFDADGNLRQWWEDGVRGRFTAKAECVVEQFNSYEVLPGVKLNGRLTLGENIADLGGIKYAFHTFRNQRKAAKEEVVAEGFSEAQQFFLAVGQVWCAAVREPFARMAAQVDPHASAKYRVNGPLSNLDEFAQAFSCTPTSKMRHQPACRVW
jgi:putative endopeptidase